MDDFFLYIFGKGKELTTLQVSVRAFIMFFVALALLRLGGMRIFAKKSAFDDVVAVMLGAILSRGVTGASPFGDTIAAAAIMILVHRVISWLCLHNKGIASLVKGKPVILYKDGTIIQSNLTKCSLSKDDLAESLRTSTNKDSLTDVETVIMENNGKISFILKKEK